MVHLREARLSLPAKACFKIAPVFKFVTRNPMCSSADRGCGSTSAPDVYPVLVMIWFPVTAQQMFAVGIIFGVPQNTPSTASKDD
jgi:hypothetical protein